MRATLLLLLLASAGCAVLAQTPAPVPIWHPRFKVDFTETTKIFVTRHTTGTLYYDSLVNAEVVDRADGNGDRYCGSVHPFARTPCRHVVKEGKRFLVFPELGDCCMCCTSAGGCGPLRPDWLSSASFEGTVPLRNLSAYKWTLKGLQTNNYYSTADLLQVPLELDQLPNDLQAFDPGSFRVTGIPPELLEVPADCKPKCPLTSVCTFLGGSGLRKLGPGMGGLPGSQQY